MTVREIQGHLTELYGIDVSPDLISRVTDAVFDEVREWQNRPLDPVYPIVFFDALRVKIRDEGLVKNKAVYVALAFNANLAFGSNRPRALNSGSRSSTNSKPEASTTF
jgi:putative transposase